MSKKSRKRNKKILGALAAGLGAMALMKRRKTNALNAITDYDVSGGAPLSGKAGYEGEFPSASVVVPKKKVVVPKKTKTLAHENWNKLDESEVDISDHYAPRKLRGNLVPPSMRGGAKHAEGYADPYYNLSSPTDDISKWNYRAKGGRVGHKSGGRVKGAGCAKRGFGRALKKK
jgi:hypothetical protein